MALKKITGVETKLKPERPNRWTAFSAILSGGIGIMAFGFLITEHNRTHDLAAVIQFLFTIPVITELCSISNQISNRTDKKLVYTSVSSLVITAIFLILIFPKIFSEAMYMIPQGVFGVSLIIICLRLGRIFPAWVKWWGIIVGVGLALVGIFPLGYAMFVDPIILHIPAPSDEAVQKIPFDTPANKILHTILYIGSFSGVITFPVWTTIVGIKLLNRRRLYNVN